MNFADMLMYYAQSNPEKRAIILLDRIITFGMIGAGKLDGLGTARARLGYAGIDRTLVYVTGGLAMGSAAGALFRGDHAPNVTHEKGRIVVDAALLI